MDRLSCDCGDIYSCDICYESIFTFDQVLNLGGGFHAYEYDKYDYTGKYWQVNSYSDRARIGEILFL